MIGYGSNVRWICNEGCGLESKRVGRLGGVSATTIQYLKAGLLGRAGAGTQSSEATSVLSSISQALCRPS